MSTKIFSEEPYKRSVIQKCKNLDLFMLATLHPRVVLLKTLVTAITNMGWRTSVICLIEQQIERKLQCVVCLLHFKSPFWHLFQTLDDEMAGPTGI